MKRTSRTTAALLLLLGAAGTAAAVAAPAHSDAVALPVQCELGRETVLAWDDLAYDLRGTCGVVRVTADDATVTMPAATELILEGTGNAVTAKSLVAVHLAGTGNSVSTPSIQTLTVTGGGSTVTVTGLVERAELTSTSSSLSAGTINVLRLRGSDSVRAGKTYRTRITGSDNLLAVTRADRLVLTGDRNSATVTQGRTTVRDRGRDNVLDLRRRTG